MEIFLGLISLLLQGFFAGSETSYTRANWIRLSTWQRNKRFGAELALRLVKIKEQVLVATLVGTNLFMVLATVLFSRYFISHFGPGYTGLAVIIVIILSLIFSEFLPKTVAQAFPDHWASIVAYPLLWSIKIFSPVTYLLTAFARGITSPLTRNTTYFIGLSRKDFVVALREYDRLRHETSDGRARLSGIAARLFEFSRMKVGEVVLPLSRVEAVAEDTSLAKFCEEVKKCSYSRYPVYQGNPENIIGVMNTKDLLFLPNPKARPAYTVSENARAIEVLTEMRHRGEHLAVVKNEKDKVIGIVTLEDLIEELVGEIRSED